MSKNIFKEKCFYVIGCLFLLTACILIFTHYEVYKTKKLIEEVEYYDSLANYNKMYYEKSFKDLKKENKQLHDSLKGYKDRITFLVQFTHEKKYSTGIVYDKPTVSEETYVTPNGDSTLNKTYEYMNEPNDTFQYKLKINSQMEPNWYSLDAKVKNKFTIVNKEEADGLNHITISDGGSVPSISDVTVFKKKEKFIKRFSIGPSVTAGYDPINNKFGIMLGVGITYRKK